MGKGHWTMADCVLDVLSDGVLMKLAFIVKCGLQVIIIICRTQLETRL